MRRFVFLRRDAFGALFQDADESRMCYDRQCLEDGPHRHSYGVGDMSAAELLGLDPLSWREAFRDLQEQDPATTLWDVLRELRAEADEDDVKARDDRGRKVA